MSALKASPPEKTHEPQTAPTTTAGAAVAPREALAQRAGLPGRAAGRGVTPRASDKCADELRGAGGGRGPGLARETAMRLPTSVNLRGSAASAMPVSEALAAQPPPRADASARAWNAAAPAAQCGALGAGPGPCTRCSAWGVLTAAPRIQGARARPTAEQRSGRALLACGAARRAAWPLHGGATLRGSGAARRGSGSGARRADGIAARGTRRGAGAQLEALWGPKKASSSRTETDQLRAKSVPFFAPLWSPALQSQQQPESYEPERHGAFP